MKKPTLIAALLVLATACAAATRAVPRRRPLEGFGEVTIYLLPLPREADALSFTVESIGLRRADMGDESADVLQLELVEKTVSRADAPSQHRLARGRVPPGRYTAVVVTVGSAALSRAGERARLLVEAQPSLAELHLDVSAGRAAVLFLSLNPAGSMRGQYGFAASLGATVAPQTPPQTALYCTDTAGPSVTVLDRRARLATGEIPVGARPRGIALDRAAARAYVALGAEDQIQILDVAADATVDRIRLTPGDGPLELGFAGDGNTLLVVNERSRTLSFVDVTRLTEVARVPLDDAPVSLLVDRQGRRAYVANRASATITVVDVATRTVVATLATDPEPLRAELNRDGTRLYVVHRGSAYLTVFGLPTFTPQARAYVALGATTLRVDTRTDLLYLSRGDERRIAVYDPVSLQPLDHFALPAPASYLAIDDAENALLALMPARRAIAVIDLTNRRLVAELPVGDDPYIFAFAGERF
jgi:YVTN family beta-propeller protein